MWMRHYLSFTTTDNIPPSRGPHIRNIKQHERSASSPGSPSSTPPGSSCHNGLRRWPLPRVCQKAQVHLRFSSRWAKKKSGQYQVPEREMSIAFSSKSFSTYTASLRIYNQMMEGRVCSLKPSRSFPNRYRSNLSFQMRVLIFVHLKSCKSNTYIVDSFRGAYINKYTVRSE